MVSAGMFLPVRRNSISLSWCEVKVEPGLGFQGRGREGVWQRLGPGQAGLGGFQLPKEQDY